VEIVGELINASRKSVRPLIENKDAKGIIDLARKQVEGGADYIDVNAGMFIKQEPEYLRWLVETVQSELDVPCCIDSPSYEAIEEALKAHKGMPMINSISLEKDRYANVMPLVEAAECKVVALCMDDTGMPETKDQRMDIANRLINELVQKGVKPDNIYVDPLVQPIGTDDKYGVEFLDTIEALKREFPDTHHMCGLSNISFDMPKRKFVNRVFMVMAIARGLDGAILNPTDTQMMASIITAETLMGRDKYCENYLNAFRQGIVDP